jgi:hypothetical protein
VASTFLAIDVYDDDDGDGDDDVDEVEGVGSARRRLSFVLVKGREGHAK